MIGGDGHLIQQAVFLHQVRKEFHFVFQSRLNSRGLLKIQDLLLAASEELLPGVEAPVSEDFEQLEVLYGVLRHDRRDGAVN